MFARYFRGQAYLFVQSDTDHLETASTLPQMFFSLQDLSVASSPLLKRDKAESAAMGLGRAAGFRKMALTCPLAKSGTAMASAGLRAACITFTVQSASAVLGPADPSSSLHFRCRLLRGTIWSAGSESKRFGTLVQRSQLGSVKVSCFAILAKQTKINY